jgi:hypothetical protein
VLTGRVPKVTLFSGKSPLRRFLVLDSGCLAEISLLPFFGLWYVA